MRIGKHDLTEIMNNLDEVRLFFQDFNETKYAETLNSYPWMNDYYKTIEDAVFVLNNYNNFLALNKTFMETVINWKSQVDEDEDIEWEEQVLEDQISSRYSDFENGPEYDGG